jgi:V/A-type H+-transporting ATPase subunit C
LSNKKNKDTAYLFLTSMLRARESKMLSPDRKERMLDAPDFDEAAKLLTDCGYPDMSGMSPDQVNAVLSGHRTAVFTDISNHAQAKHLADLFRLKYDYHNIKVLVKAMGANTDGGHILSDSGRVAPGTLTEAFITGVRGSLPPEMALAIHESVGILSRTKNPQLADIEIDKIYFRELTAIAEDIGNAFVSGYVRLLIDSANLRTAVRMLRMKRDNDFLKTAVINGGNVNTDRLLSLSGAGEELNDLFGTGLLREAAHLGIAAVGGGQMTQFERECDNAVTSYLSDSKLVSFGIPPVFAYLAALETEVTSIRMILTGKLSGIAPEIIRERLRNSYV